MAYHHILDYYDTDFFLSSSTAIELVVKNNKEFSSCRYMMQIKIAFLPVALFVLIALLIFSFSNVKIAYAHTTKKFGNILLEIGWSNEPPLVGELNNAIIQVNQTSGKNTQTPVINALANMDIEVKYRWGNKTT